MPLNIRNLAAIKNGTATPAQHGEAWDDMIAAIQTIANQTNSEPQAEPPAPPQIGSLVVSAAGGITQAVITDGSPVNRGVNYFFEHSTTPNFAQPHVIDNGTSRTLRANLGNQTLYWRAYSQYPTGKPSAPVYHGTAASPKAVLGGGVSPGPAIPPSTGSGTAPTDGRTGGAGFGIVAQRS